MNKIITMIVVLLAASLGNVSFGMMGSHKLATPQRPNKLQSPSSHDARRKAFHDLHRDLRSKATIAQENRKRIEQRPSKDEAVAEAIFPKDILMHLGNYSANKELRATCRFMKDHCKVPLITRMEDFWCGNSQWIKKTTWPTEHDVFVYVEELDSIRNSLSPDYLRSDEGILIAEESDMMVANRLFKNWIPRWELTPNIMVYVNKQREQRELEKQKIDKNNEDCLRAFDFAICCDDVKSLSVLLQKNKEEVGLHCIQNSRVYSFSKQGNAYPLYKSWLIKAIKKDSKNVFEFLVQDNPFDLNNYCCHNPMRKDMGPIICDIEKSGKIAADKKDKYIAICTKHGCKTLPDFEDYLID